MRFAIIIIIILGLVLGVAPCLALPGSKSLLDHPANARLRAALARVESEKVAVRVPTKVSTPVQTSCPTRKIHTAYQVTSPPVEIRSVDPKLLELINREATRVGVDPVTMLAIQWWETAGYKSRLWIRNRNPGGIGGAGNFRWYPTVEAGIRGHAECLAKDRYAGVRSTDDPIREVDVIANGGYAEYSRSWTKGVKSLVYRFRSWVKGKAKKTSAQVD